METDVQSEIITENDLKTDELNKKLTTPVTNVNVAELYNKKGGKPKKCSKTKKKLNKK